MPESYKDYLNQSYRIWKMIHSLPIAVLILVGLMIRCYLANAKRANRIDGPVKDALMFGYDDQAAMVDDLKYPEFDTFRTLVAMTRKDPKPRLSGQMIPAKKKTARKSKKAGKSKV